MSLAKQKFYEGMEISYDYKQEIADCTQLIKLDLTASIYF